jgi:hypothetical protein
MRVISESNYVVISKGNQPRLLQQCKSNSCQAHDQMTLQRREVGGVVGAEGGEKGAGLEDG